MIQAGHKWICSAAFVLLLFVALRSSALTDDPLSAKASSSAPVVPAVVQLLAIGPGQSGRNRECSATGFLVNEEGYVLTNAHVVEEAQACLAAAPGARILAKLANAGARTATAVSCNLVGVDELHDLALMKTDRPLPLNPGQVPAPYVFLDPGQMAEGTRVAVAGHPAFEWHPVTQSGQIIRRARVRLSAKSAAAAGVIVLDIPLRRGNSGSPVYLEAGGGVVGVVERQNISDRAQTIAVPIRHAIDLLNRHGVRWHRSPE